ncbi:Bug family tripartite tricarboxylate transporter substrate binding protein [Paraburkholderia phymatum]|uniref:Bug family tripartite tricarboxylate transporter substrate binding protein n=1 Tax=Paraburkholderia phymatum TaxID=148447 RepID=A0ACC6U2F6_9BURK
MYPFSKAATVVLGALVAFSTGAHAENYPSHPVHVIVGYTPGGASDIVGRLIASGLSQLDKQNFIVENKPGAGGMLGMAYVANATPDGYVIGVSVSGTMVTGPHLQKNVPYDPLNSFAPIGMIAKAPMVMLSSPEFKDPTVKNIVSQAKAQPGRIKSGQGAKAFELAQRLFNAKAGVDIGVVSYRGGAPAAIDVMAGRVTLMVDTIGAQLGSIQGGKLVPVAVLDSKRSSLLPNVPTVAEAGVPGYEAAGWLGLVAPKGTPPQIVAALNNQLAQVLAQPDVAKKLQSLGYEPNPSATPQAFDQVIHTEYAKWGKVVTDAGIQPE